MKLDQVKSLLRNTADVMDSSTKTLAKKSK